jgi:hypothetical protein
MDTSSQLNLFNLHIIGVQKAGTTALAHFLNQHPDVYVADHKEAHVFDHPDFSSSKDKSAFAHQRYNAKLTNYQNQAIRCDATPITAFRTEYLQACYQYNPEAKFIILLRDPIERAVSHYRMSLSRGQEHRAMLSAFLLEPFRLVGIKKSGPWGFDDPYRHHSYLRRGCYAAQLKRVLAIIPKQQLLVLHQENLQQNHVHVLQQVFNFIGVTPVNVPAQQVYVGNKGKPQKSDALAKLYAKCYFTLRKENITRWQRILDKR